MYYPNADEENSEFLIEYGRFRLNYSSELTFEDFAIRTLELENIEVRNWSLCHNFFASFHIKNNYSKKKNASFIIVIIQIGQISVSQNTQHHFLIFSMNATNSIYSIQAYTVPVLFIARQA